MKIKKIYINIFLINSLMLLNLIASSQVDEGVNYKIDSKSSSFGSQINQCDVIYTSKGINISSSIKQIDDGYVSYKTCNDYGVNASILGTVKTIKINQINKIVFSDGSVKFFKSKKEKKLPVINQIEPQPIIDSKGFILGLDFAWYNTFYFKYLNLKKVGYYSSVYTDGFSDQIGLSGGVTFRVFKFLNIYSGIGYEFVDSEGQLEFGYIQRGIFFKKLIYDVGYRYNFDYPLYDGFRIGVGFKF